MNEYYYLNTNKEPQGPHTIDELRALLATGKLRPDTLAARRGDTIWRDLQTLLNAPVYTMPIVDQSAPAGTCPACSTNLSATNNQLPEQCPSCGYKLRALDINNLWQNFLLALRKAFVFKGRAPRIEYWSFVLFCTIFAQVFNTVIQIVLTAALPQVMTALDSPRFDNSIEELSIGSIIFLVILGIVYLLVNLAITIPQISVTVRRLHDVGRSGKWLLGYFVILAFWIISMIAMFVGVITYSGSDDFAPVLLIIFILMLLILIAYYVYLFVLTVLDSQRGPNKYGPSPKYPLS